jgi:hypothetical protein
LSDDEPDVEEELRSVWQRLSLKQLRWTVVALVLLVTAAFGGLKTAHHVTSLAFGQAYTAGAVRITPRSVLIADKWVGMPDLSIDTWADFDKVQQPGPCRYLVLAVTIQNTAKESVPFPLASVVSGKADDCAPNKVADTEMFGIAGIAGRYAATFRGHESIPAPTIEPGFTNDYSVLWTVPRTELTRHPQIGIRFYNMYQYYSTFLIARNWAGDSDHYAELRIPNQDLS